MAHHLKKTSKYFMTSISKENGIITCLLKHHPVNVITLESLQKLQSFLMDLECHKPKGLIFISDYDRKWFSAGFDFKDFYEPCKGRLSKLIGTINDFSTQLRSTSFPTASVINGNSLGGGCIIPFGCEYRVMLNDCKIGLNEVSFGFGVLEWQSLWMSDIIGTRLTEEAILQAKLFSSEEAVQVGLVHKSVSSKEEGMDKAIEYINQMEKINCRGRVLSKLSLKSDFLKKMQDRREYYIRETINVVTNSDVQETLSKRLRTLRKERN